MYFFSFLAQLHEDNISVVTTYIVPLDTSNFIIQCCFVFEVSWRL